MFGAEMNSERAKVIEKADDTKNQYCLIGASLEEMHVYIIIASQINHECGLMRCSQKSRKPTTIRTSVPRCAV